MNQILKKVIFSVFMVLMTMSGYSQNLNGYKYVIVPKKYDFLKKENQYQLNVLTKFLYEKSNFEVLYEDELPEDYARNNCLALKSDVRNKSGVLTTKLLIELIDCRGNVVFTSKEGRSKEKEYKKGYQTALRNAFNSIKALNYKYDPSIAERTVVVDPKPVTESVSVVEEEKTVEPSKILSQENNQTETVIDAKTTVTQKKGVSDNVVAQQQTATKTAAPSGLLYAQAVDNGYQLVDNTPKIVFVLQKTSLKDVFLLKNKKGNFFKKDGKWIAEYYNESGELIQQEVNVKF